MITQQQLSDYLGKSIADICQNGYTNPAEHHAAHFVSHVLGYSFGVTCQMTGAGTGPAASLRADDLFPKCKSVGVWSLRPASLSTCLVFVARAANVNLMGKSITHAPRKHVGIFLGGVVWHYSSKNHQVVREAPSLFALHQPSPDNALFYGSLP
jgi:hypothetical protein